MGSIASFAFTYRGALVPIAAAAAFVFPGSATGPVDLAAALTLLALGIGLRILGVRCLGGRARVHTAGARTLATEGIFGQVRNPIYLGNIAFAAALMALVASWAAAALLAAYLLSLYTIIALHEERVLLDHCGTPYREYLDSVPRWLWRPRQRAGASSGARTPWREVLVLERWFILSGIVSAAVAELVPVHVSRLLPADAPLYNLLGIGIVLLVSAGLFVRVGIKVHRKRRSRSALGAVASTVARTTAP